MPDPHLTPVLRLPPAKLNLTLAVVGRRNDGFHDLHSVFVPLALTDRLSLAPVRASAGEDSLHVTGFDAGPVADNLVLRAIAAARAAVGEGPGRPETLASPPGSRSTSRSPPGSVAGRRTRRPPSTARSRRGAPSSTTNAARTRRPRSAPTCRSSSAGSRRWSKGAASA